MSTYIQEVVTTPPNTSVQPISANEVHNASEVLSGILSGAGGLGAGLLVYKTLKMHLPNDGRISENEREIFSLIAAVSAGLLAAYGISKLLSK